MSTPHEVQSPLPGTFYRSASPDMPPFKSDGDDVAEGEVIGLVEVMKQFSEVTADASGRIQRFLVGNGEPIDSGQALLLIDLP